VEIEIIQVPYEVERTDTAAARSPAGLLAHGFLDRLREAGWTVHESEVRVRSEDSGGRAARAAILAEVGRAIAGAVADACSHGRFPLVLSGGCLAAVGVIAGLERDAGTIGGDVGLVWIDAHGDFNTPESTLSGYWDGMALAAVCGRCLPEVYQAVELRPVPFRNVVHLAGRDFDPSEAEDLERLNLTVIPPTAVGTDESDEQIERCLAGPLARPKPLYLHVDLDGLDPQDAPAVHFPVPGGPPLDRLLESLGRVSRRRPPAAMTLSGISFERVDEAGAERMAATAARLVDRLLPARR
jgi:arginase